MTCYENCTFCHGDAMLKEVLREKSRRYERSTVNCVNSINHHFFNPELMITTYTEKCGVLHVILVLKKEVKQLVLLLNHTSGICTNFLS